MVLHSDCKEHTAKQAGTFKGGVSLSALHHCVAAPSSTFLPEGQPNVIEVAHGDKCSA